jgi:ABC-type sugar transport system permease subunit
VLWSWVLAADPNRGLLSAGWRNTVGHWFGIPPPGWLTMPEYTKQSLIIMGVWGAGGGILLWLAGLKGIPRELYENSSIDGAGPARQLWSITLPQLSSVIFFNAVVGLIAAIQEFDRPYVLLRGNPSPGDSLMMPVTRLFTNAFGYFKMGYASALAWLIFILILAITALQFRISRRWVRYEVEG